MASCADNAFVACRPFAATPAAWLFRFAMKSAFSGAGSSRPSTSSVTLREGDGRSSSKVATENVTPRITTPCSSTARNNVEPRRSLIAGRAEIRVGGASIGIDRLRIISDACRRLSAAARGRAPRVAKFPADRVDQLSSDVDAVLAIQLTNSGGARDVDLGEVVADHVEAREQHALCAQRRTDLRA